jgi:predicted RNA binding protein YcfA (HicA-like mRNA interferase family)
MKTSKLPLVNSDDCVRVLQSLGFYISRRAENHLQMRLDSARPVTIPIPLHTKHLPNGTLRNILRQSGLTIEALTSLLN